MCVASHATHIDLFGPRAVSGEGIEGAEAHGFDYDLVVIGGGSGGLACSKEAAKLGKKVRL